MGEIIRFKPIQFEATLVELADGKVGLVAPFSAVDVFGVRERIPVQGTCNEVAYSGWLNPIGSGQHAYALTKTMARQLRLRVGDTIRVTMELDNTKPLVAAPKDFQDALNANPAAKATFQGYPYSHQREYIEAIEAAKRPDTRRHRIEQAIEMLVSARRPAGR